MVSKQATYAENMPRVVSVEARTDLCINKTLNRLEVSVHYEYKGSLDRTIHHDKIYVMLLHGYDNYILE